MPYTYEVSTVQQLVDAINNQINTNTTVDHTLVLLGNLEFTTYDNDGGSSQGANALPIINANLTIEGNGFGLIRNSAQNFRLLRSSKNLILNNLKLEGGRTSGTSSNGKRGAVALTTGTSLSLSACVLENNGNSGTESILYSNPQTVVTDCQVINMTGRLVSGSCQVSNTTFASMSVTEPLFFAGNNQTLDLAGVGCAGLTSTSIYGLIFSGGILSLRSCSFENCTTNFGVVRSLGCTETRLSDCQFIANSNEAACRIDQADGLVEIGNCLFSNNTLALSLDSNSGDAQIYQSSFTGNGSSRAVEVTFSGVNNLVQFTNCEFRDNQSSNSGGAVYALAGTGRLGFQQCQFIQNEGVEGGGAIHVLPGSYADVRIEDSIFAGNKVTGLTGSGRFGGAVRFGNGKFALSIIGSQFIDNEVLHASLSTAKGGAIYIPSDGTNSPIVVINECHFVGNQVGTNGTTPKSDAIYNAHATSIVDARDNWWGEFNGPSDRDGASGATGTGDGVTVRVNYLPYLGEALILPEHDCDCGCDAYASKRSCRNVGNPISSREGEKRYSVTDLSVNTPNGALAFTRLYRQLKQDPNLSTDKKVLGLGWTHNHIAWLELIDDGGTPPVLTKIIAHLPGYNEIHLVPASNPDILVGLTGSTDRLEKKYVSSVLDRYELISGDKSIYVFDTATPPKLIQRVWTNGDYWTYSYDGSGRLAQVEDSVYDLGSGVKRKLVFKYYTSGSHTGYLYRVGDHSLNDSTTPPTGRYVEMNYVTDKIWSGGAKVAGSDRLLSTVYDAVNTQARDLAQPNGHSFYNYYGQESTENTEALLNLVTQREFRVDTDGDGDVESTAVLESLNYTKTSGEITAINQSRGNGLLVNDLAFNPSTSGETYTTETVDIVVAKYHFYNGFFTGKEDALHDTGFEVLNGDLRPAFQQDAQGSTTWLNWSTDKITNGDFEDTTGWTNVGSPTTSQRVTATGSDQVYEGAYAWRVVGGTGTGVESSTWDLIAERRYKISAWVYLKSGSVTMQISGTAQTITLTTLNTWRQLTLDYTPTSASTGKTLQFVGASASNEFYVDAAVVKESGAKQLSGLRDAQGNATEFNYDAQDRLLFSYDAQGHKTRYYYSGSTPQPAEIKVYAGTALQHWQKFTYDSHGNITVEKTLDPTSPGTEVVTQQVERAYYASGDGVGLLETLTHKYLPSGNDQSAAYFYDRWGRVIQTNQNSQFGSCLKTRTVYDYSGRVSASLCGFELPVVSGTASDNGSTGTAGNAFDNNPATTWQSGALPTWLNYAFASAGKRTIQRIGLTSANSNDAPKDFTIQGQNSGGSWTTLVTITGQTGWSSGETRTFSFTNTTAYDTYRLNVTATAGSTSQVALQEWGLFPSDYPATVQEALNLVQDTTDPNLNRLTTYAYDTQGRQTSVTTNAGRTSDQTGVTLYDTMDRVTRSVSHYTASSDPATWTFNTTTFLWMDGASEVNHGTDGTENRISETFYNQRGQVWKQIDAYGHVSLYGYDDAGRQIKVIQNASNATYNGLTDVDLSGYTPGSTIGKDLISESIYDKVGNLVQSKQTVSNSPLVVYNDFTVYDRLNRVVKTVRRAKDTATIALNVGDTGYDATKDPRSTAYVSLADPDRDLITLTDYNAMGQVLRTCDELGNWTLYGYDSLGRQVKTIRSASRPTYDTVADPSLTNYVTSSAADKDIIATTVYGNDGRVKYTTDANGVASWVAYDGLGRTIKTILNPSVSDPRGSYTPSTDPAKDIITWTVYDSDGRVQSTEDVLGRKTHLVYDSQGRQVKTIGTYVVQGSSDPADWFWSTTNTRWEYSMGNAVSFGTNNDQNQISATVYDSQGRVESTRDVVGNVSRSVYDVSGRRFMSISNYVVQGSSDPANWVWDATDGRWEDGAGTAIDFGSGKNQNLMSHTTFDGLGRVLETRDTAGKVTRFVYDDLGRRVKTIGNYVPQGSTNPLNWVWDTTDGRWEDGAGTAIAHGTAKDENLISQTSYNHIGQVTDTRDSRGTQTTLGYDAVGRGRTLKLADGTSLATLHWTCYDKGGRTQRVIANCTYTGSGDSPDAKDNSGNWLYNPSTHGTLNDQDLITTYTLDALGRVTQTQFPHGATRRTTYGKDGRVVSSTDPLGVITKHFYDDLGRLTRVVINHTTTTDPATWVWDSGQSRWETATGSAITFGTNNDQNIIALVTLDKVGRKVDLRDPRGKLTSYTYDQLNRRLSLTNPLSHTWNTAYAYLSGGGRRVSVTNPLSEVVQQDFDRVGRLAGIQYPSSSTPDVAFSYDVRGNQTKMSETLSSTTLRETHYGYDGARRMTSVGFDKDGNATIDETVSYTYDVGGLRTLLTLPDSKTIAYLYDAKGQLTKLTDWGSSQFTDYTYDSAGRLHTVERSNDLDSLYAYDLGGRLLTLQHLTPSTTLAHFGYTVDARNNRAYAVEGIRRAESGTQVVASSDSAIAYTGTWTTNGDAKETSGTSASLQVSVFGGSMDITLKTGADRGICEVFVDNVSWGTRDTYAASSGEDTFTVTMSGPGLHVVKIQNTANKNASSSGYVLSFKQVVLPNKYDLHTLKYTYDALARLWGADTYPAQNLSASLLREYDFAYDVTGNRTSEVVKVNGSTTSNRTFTYNNNNALTNDGTNTYTYDNAGRMTSNSKTWDQADRLTGEGDSSLGDSMVYNGHGQRIGRNFHNTLFSRDYDFLLDVQPGLYKMLASTFGTFTTRYVHDPAGLHRQQQSDGSWVHLLTDGLGSVRLATDSSGNLTFNEHFAPYGSSVEQVGTDPTLFGFTGEPTDELGRVHLRARYYNPNLGVFPNLDPVEGGLGRVMGLNRYGYVAGNVANGAVGELLGLNRYSYVGGNPVNLIDPSGMHGEQPGDYANVCGVSGQNPCTVNSNSTILEIIKTLQGYKVSVDNICEWEATTRWGGNSNLAQNAEVAITETLKAVRDAANRLGDFYHTLPKAIFMEFMPGPIRLVIDNDITRMMISNPNGDISINYDDIECIVRTPAGKCFYNVLIHELGHMVDFTITLRFGLNPLEDNSVLGDLLAAIADKEFRVLHPQVGLGFVSASTEENQPYTQAELVADIIGNWFAGTIDTKLAPGMEPLAEAIIRFVGVRDPQILAEILDRPWDILLEGANGLP